VASQPVPYESASSGAAARDEITKLLRRLGCESVGFMDNFDRHEVVLQFVHRKRPVVLRASVKGWAALYLKSHPYTHRTRGTRVDHEAKALRQGFVAVNSILRDWVKGQVMAVECGVMSFEMVFVGHMLGDDGRSLLDHLNETKMLPAPSPA
jgi:hypothetical protein